MAHRQPVAGARKAAVLDCEPGFPWSVESRACFITTSGPTGTSSEQWHVPPPDYFNEICPTRFPWMTISCLTENHLARA
ncbi:hypothetical protein FVEN_g12764 [Fusarium venenatum]|uniref:Uncharacterized protein n=1 Tax=Fusarium venenatum TaxID=56646 RepID=A0A2L2TYN8_9HYPO|nr:uncharacterized protein FVRRES_02637 [Fusarium venenatum]KAG8357906.1 hypothetical protein FVEN_g12764 [Fusarium venenatum]CEI66125.1 unnamed protein product [Fusarium venenatum]